MNEPQALQSDFGPSGPLRHSGESTVPLQGRKEVSSEKTERRQEGKKNDEPVTTHELTLLHPRLLLLLIIRPISLRPIRADSDPESAIRVARRRDESLRLNEAGRGVDDGLVGVLRVGAERSGLVVGET